MQNFAAGAAPSLPLRAETLGLRPVLRDLVGVRNPRTGTLAPELVLLHYFTTAWQRASANSGLEAENQNQFSGERRSGSKPGPEPVRLSGRAQPRARG